ncbi:MAG: hypothetical protein WC480_02535 [Patescibacteria group bacterium]
MIAEQNYWQEAEEAKDLRFYLKVIRKPFFIGFLVISLFYLISLVSFLDWSKAVLNYLSWGVKIIVAIYISWVISKEKKADVRHPMTAAAIAGLGLGLLVAILKSIWFFSWWQIVNLIVEPVLTALVGLILAWLVSRIFQIKNKIGEGSQSSTNKEQ